MIKSLLENGTPDEQTQEYIKELDLSLAERDLSTKRIERYRSDLRALKKELALWRNKCTEAEINRDENYRKYREAQRDLELLEDERRAQRDRNLLDRSSPNLSACSSMIGGHSLPPPPPPTADIDELFDMTRNHHTSSYLVNNHKSTNSNSYNLNGEVYMTPPPPPLPPQFTGDMLIEQSLAKINLGSTGFSDSRPNVAGRNGHR